MYMTAETAFRTTRSDLWVANFGMQHTMILGAGIRSPYRVERHMAPEIPIPRIEAVGDYRAVQIALHPNRYFCYPSAEYLLDNGTFRWQKRSINCRCSRHIEAHRERGATGQMPTVRQGRTPFDDWSFCMKKPSALAN